MSTVPGFDLTALLEALAAKVAEKMREIAALGTVSAVRPRLLTVEQAAMYIGRTKQAVEHMVSSGKVPTVRADRRVFVDIRDLDTWIEQNKQVGMV
jgi:excisionase family DNA binding protein